MAMSRGDVLIGIDGGGSHTRVIVCGADGSILSHVELKAAASRHKDVKATENVHRAVREALSGAGREPGDVRGLAAGIAGYDNDEDRIWVEPLTDLAGLDCEKWHVNDAVVAHYGALMAQPGIVAVAGTGSILFGITEDGTRFRNYDFHHYAASAARFLAYDAVFEALAGYVDDSDHDVVLAMLDHWGAASLKELGALGKSGFAEDDRERDRRFGDFAPIVTEGAARGSTLSRSVCDRAVRQTIVGLRLLAGHFAGNTVTVACIGSVINSAYFRQRLEGEMAAPFAKRFRLIEPRFSPAAGAVLYAMERLGIGIDDHVLDNLNKGPSG